MAGVAFNATAINGVGLASGIGDFPTTALSYEITFASAVSGPGDIALASYSVGTGGAANEFLIEASSGRWRPIRASA